MILERLRTLGRQQKFFLKLIFIACLAILLTIVSVAFLLVESFYSVAKKDLNANQLHMTGQYASQFNDLQQAANMAANILLSSADVIGILDGSQTDAYDKFMLNERVRSVLVQYPLIDSISVINQTRSFYYDSSSTNAETNRKRFQEYASGAGLQRFYYFLNPDAASADEARNDNRLIMVIPYRFSSITFAPDGTAMFAAGIMISMDADYAFRPAEFYKLNSSNSLLVLNGDELLCSFSALDGESLKRYAGQIASSVRGASGNQDMVLDGKRYLVSYSSESPYTVVALSDYKQFFYNTNAFKGKLLVICFTIFCSTLLLIFMMLRKTYKPIGYIVSSVAEQFGGRSFPDASRDEVDYLRIKFGEMRTSIEDFSLEMKKSRPYIKRQLIVSLLHGGATPNHAQLMQQYFPSFLRCRYFQVIIVEFRPTDEANEEDAPPAQRYSDAERVISEFLGERDYIVFEDGQHGINVICGFVSPDSGLDKQSLKPLQLSLSAKEIDSAIFIGKRVGSLGDVVHSYDNAHELRKSKFIFGLSAIINEDDVQGLITSTFVIQNNLDHILKALKSSDSDTLIAEIEDVFGLIGHCCYDLAMLIINTLLYHIVETANHLLKSKYESGKNVDVNNIHLNLTRLQTLDEAKQYVMTICFSLISEIDALRDNSKYALYQGIKTYISEHLCDHALSLDKIGGHFGLSSGYVGKIFASFHATGATEFINQSRIELSKELLVHSSAPVAEIGEKIGFQSSAYYISIFKKYVGATPNSYRKSARVGNAGEQDRSAPTA